MILPCTGCGQDCSRAYATWHGYPYHVSCLPTKASHMRNDAGTLAAETQKDHDEEREGGWANG